MVAAEVLKNGERVGFDLQDNHGNMTPLSRTNKITEYSVGRYFVDVNSLDVFVERPFEFTPDQLLFIDEIGHMQLYSPKFQNLVSKYLDSRNDFIGKISSVYEHVFIDEVHGKNNNLLCTVGNYTLRYCELQFAIKNPASNELMNEGVNLNTGP